MKFVFHHVAIIAGDYAISKRFYTEILGFKVIKETYREARKSWKLDLQIDGGGQIELFSFPNAPNRPTRPAVCGILRSVSLTLTKLWPILRQRASSWNQCASMKTLGAASRSLPIQMVCRLNFSKSAEMTKQDQGLKT